ncbi:hypothetical protein CABS01_02629 [Colletotrichum abscissum]|uniref:Tautomerase cis-CaaD-like domain-containing protein n=1 Tax=Colletotrichum abscissum TaxID=1671311 RepID=A0A9P9XPG1_9PEZI|nr:uncharacterized protein CABS01_02629 [Colletotrichum abscissum]KAI3558071.1 hypothetical protein CABS02_01744 [Colletotrichum abscissum]KAK1482893.1 hypothetical protein CABS01_02629 [Colletotrichum abscissum]
MPKWVFNCNTGIFTTAEKKQIAEGMTKLYTSVGLPGFYCHTHFIELNPENMYAGGETPKALTTVSIYHIARGFDTPQVEAFFFKALDDILRPILKPKGIEWESGIYEARRELWRINGLVPPETGSEMEKKISVVAMDTRFELVMLAGEAGELDGELEGVIDREDDSGDEVAREVVEALAGELDDELSVDRDVEEVGEETGISGADEEKLDVVVDRELEGAVVDELDALELEMAGVTDGGSDEMLVKVVEGKVMTVVELDGSTGGKVTGVLVVLVLGLGSGVKVVEAILDVFVKGKGTVREVDVDDVEDLVELLDELVELEELVVEKGEVDGTAALELELLVVLELVVLLDEDDDDDGLIEVDVLEGLELLELLLLVADDVGEGVMDELDEEVDELVVLEDLEELEDVVELLELELDVVEEIVELEYVLVLELLGLEEGDEVIDEVEDELVLVEVVEERVDDDDDDDEREEEDEEEEELVDELLDDEVVLVAVDDLLEDVEVLDVVLVVEFPLDDNDDELEEELKELVVVVVLEVDDELEVVEVEDELEDETPRALTANTS